MDGPAVASYALHTTADRSSPAAAVPVVAAVALVVAEHAAWPAASFVAAAVSWARVSARAIALMSPDAGYSQDEDVPVPELGLEPAPELGPGLGRAAAAAVERGAGPVAWRRVVVVSWPATSVHSPIQAVPVGPVGLDHSLIPVWNQAQRQVVHS